MQSFGHDIETSWLLVEAAEVLCESGDPMDRLLYLECLGASRELAAAATEGLTSEGMTYEYDPASGYRKDDRDWWVQAEAVVGYLNRWQLAPTTAPASGNVLTTMDVCAWRSFIVSVKKVSVFRNLCIFATE